jgi:hypothetical protein
MKRIAVMVNALLLASQAALAAGAIKPGDPCFKKTYEKTSSSGERWLVKECFGEDDGAQHIQVDMRDAKLQQYVASFAAPDAEAITDIQYTLIAPDTLFIQLGAERGGRGYLLHPVSGGKVLSTRRFNYMSGDEDGIVIKQTGNTIRAKTVFEDITVILDEQGALGVAKIVPTRRGPARK